jgi:hypothetical protein
MAGENRGLADLRRTIIYCDRRIVAEGFRVQLASKGR